MRQNGEDATARRTLCAGDCAAANDNASVVGSRLRDEWLRGATRGADVVLVAHHEELTAHWPLLCAHSLYLRWLFFSAAAEPPSRVYLDTLGVTSVSARMAVQFAYTGRLAVSVDRFYLAYAAAVQLDMPQLRRLLDAYLVTVADDDDCLALWSVEMAVRVGADETTRQQIVRCCADRLARLPLDEAHVGADAVCALIGELRSRADGDDAPLLQWALNKCGQLDARQADRLLEHIRLDRSQLARRLRSALLQVAT